MTDKVQVDGNKEVQDLFVKWKKISEEGDMKFAIVVASRSSEDVQADLAGVRGCEFAAYYGLDRVKRNLVQSLESGMPNTIAPGMNFGMDHWLYMLDQWTTGYDFYQWLLNVDLVRRKNNVTTPLKIYFHPDAGPQRDLALSHPGRKQLFYNVVLPMIELYGAVVTEEKGGNVFDPMTMLSYKKMIEVYKEGYDISFARFHATEESKKIVQERFGDRKPVILTLREADHNAYRNNDISVWVEFAKWLKDQGEDVIFLRDTAKADEPIEGFETYPEASKDFNIRVALYLRARCCGFGSNGCHGIVTFSDTPWFTLYPLDNNQSYKWNNPDKWAHHLGIQPGEQLPWCTPHQKIILKPESLENLQEAWHAVGLGK